ncbi:MAG: DUF2807 domain-containing protein [Puia sp.]|nr:DUF2807 domain-containing protein [Puia sp.]
MNKRLKQAAFLAVLLLSAGMLSAQKTVINDPNAVTRSVKGFHAIEVSNAINLYLSQGGEEVVAVSAEDTAARDRIRTVVVDGVLRISFDNEGWRSWKGKGKLRAYISFVTLDKLGASGASDIFVDGVISGSKLDLSLSGASDFKGAVHLDELQISQSGASDILITGSVASVTTIKASGASDVKGYDLTTESCSVNLSGASAVKITVNKELTAHASGASSVSYKGNGVISGSHTSGASSVSKKG